MVNPKDFDTLSSELANRLDALFGENDIQLPNISEKKQNEDYPLAELKNLMLSIDWEITDEVLDNLLLQLKELLQTYRHDKIVTTFLQILNSLGNYIRTHRAKAHPKTFKILNSVFVSLDKVVLSKEMTASAKKKILRTEMNRYKELRAQIAKSKAPAAAKRSAKPIATQDIESKNKTDESAIRLDQPSVAPDGKEKEEAPVIVLEEASEGPDVKPKEKAPGIVVAEASEAPAVKEKEEMPPIVAGETSAAADALENEKASVTETAEMSVVPELNDKETEPVLDLNESSEPPAVAATEGLPIVQPDSARDPAVATLADAVQEIKQYIHTEINALKKEIQSLREQL